MHSSGDAFVDARRCDAIKYIFRDKENLLEDLKKAKHCLEAAIEQLGKKKSAEINTYKSKSLPGLPGADGQCCHIAFTDTTPKLPSCLPISKTTPS